MESINYYDCFICKKFGISGFCKNQDACFVHIQNLKNIEEKSW